jgi:hypothetical protein
MTIMEKMQDAMMKRYKMFAGLGLLIVLIAFLLSFQASGANATFFSVDKATREAAGMGSTIALANVTRNVIPYWVPSFKFVGLGLLLGGITMALGIIATTLRNLGTDVTSRWPAKLNPGTPEKPRAAKLFPLLMMMGWMILIIGLIWALATNSTVTAYWNNSIAATLNPAEPGSALLNQLGLITGLKPWFGALMFTGMAFLFSGIAVALTVIIRTLQTQEKLLHNFVRARTATAA